MRFGHLMLTTRCLPAPQRLMPHLPTPKNACSPKLSTLALPLCSPRGPFGSCPSSLAELGSSHPSSQACPQMLLAVPLMLHPALSPHIHAPALPLASEAVFLPSMLCFLAKFYLSLKIEMKEPLVQEASPDPPFPDKVRFWNIANIS